MGTTCWFDEGRKISATLLDTQETNTSMKHWPARPGDAFTMEGRLAYKFSEYLALGDSGYTNWQVTSDRGNDVNWDKSSKYRVYGTGPHVRIRLPFIKP